MVDDLLTADFFSELDSELLTAPPSHGSNGSNGAHSASPCPSANFVLNPSPETAATTLHSMVVHGSPSGAHSVAASAANLSAFDSAASRRTKRRKGKRKKQRRGSVSAVGYDPSSALRAQGNIQISKSL